MTSSRGITSNSTIDTTNDIQTNNIITNSSTTKNYDKYLIDKKQYIAHILLIIALVLILCGIFLIIFIRRSDKSKYENIKGSSNLTNEMFSEKIPKFEKVDSNDFRNDNKTAQIILSSEIRNNNTKNYIVENTSNANIISDINTMLVAEKLSLTKGKNIMQHFDVISPTVNDNPDLEALSCTSIKSKQCLPVLHRKSENERNIPSEDVVANLGHFMGWYPKRYELNITIRRNEQISYSGNIDIYAEAIETVSSLSLHVGRPISEITLSQITVYNCQTGETYCISSMVYHQNDEVLLLEFFEPIVNGHIVVLHIANFASQQVSNGLIVKSPQNWESKRPWTVTTFFQFRNARSVFPCFDLPVMKATMKMCVTHPASTNARSNTKLVRKSELNNRMIESCFEQTPPISSYLYAFTIFDRMNSLREAEKSQEHVPDIEVLYSEEDSISKPNWIVAETEHAIKMMENISGLKYPLDKISMMASFLPVYGVENFGLIVLDERFMAYPKYRLAHTILAHEIAQQWIGNIVTIKNWKELCLQEGLSTYLEWLITKSLNNSTDIDELIGEKRREGIMKDSTTNTTIISEFHSHDDIIRCFDKAATFFVMLELGFGQGTVVKVVKLLMEQYKYKNAGVEEWRKVIEKSANPLAGQFFDRYFTQPGLPLIRVSVNARKLTLTQSITIEKKQVNMPPTVVPLNVAIEGEPNRSVLILTNRTQTFHLKHDGILVVDPDARTHTIIIYDPEDYLRYIQCIERSSCQALLKPATMKRIADDFCWAFLGDHFTIPESKPQKAPVWIHFMQIFSKTEYVRGSCACCMNKDLVKSGTVRCKWHWKDVCEKLNLLKQIQHLA